MKRIYISVCIVSTFILLDAYKAYQFYPVFNWRMYFVLVSGFGFLTMLIALLINIKVKNKPNKLT